jgi:hypothetical protein
LEREVRQRARQQLALERQLTVAQSATDRAARGRRGTLVAGGPAGRRGCDYEDWLDQREGRLPLTRVDLRSRNDDLAHVAVAAAGGVEAVIEATGLHTRENVLRLIDPVICTNALDNDAAAPVRDRLRRLPADRELVLRRAGGETLRSLAADYQVAHTTLCRYFQRPEVARQLRHAKRRSARRR